MSSRWKHKTEEVVDGENRQKVRGLTAGEREKFIELNRKAKAGELQPMGVAREVVKFACVDPEVSAEDVESMPIELFDKCVKKIMELTGLDGETLPGEKGEKKEPLQH